MHAPGRLRLAAAFAAIYVVWGSTYLGIHVAIETIPPLTMSAARFGIAGALLYAWARRAGAPPPSAVHWRSAASVGLLLLLGGNGGISWAQQRVASGPASLLVATVPLWLLLLERFLEGARIAPGAAAGIALGFAGVALLLGPAALLGDAAVAPSDAAVILAASIAWAAGSLRSRRVPLPSSRALATAMEMLTGAGFLLLGGLLAGEGARLDLSAVSLRSAVALAYLTIFGSLVGFSAYVWLLDVAPAARVATYAYVNPVVAVALARLFEGATLTPRILAAAATVVAGVALVVARRAPDEPDEGASA